MHADRQGNALSGATGTAAGLFDDAVRAFNIYRGDPIALADEAIAAAPGFVMAYILKAWLLALATEPDATAAARGIVDHAKTLTADDRERSHIAALERLLANDWTDAAIALDHHSMRHPHDLVALQVGHLTDFYRASARNLRDRPARALPAWREDRPGYAIVLGMHAFGLEETGDYARAETLGREAVGREPLDCWAHHAVAHVFEMQGRCADGLAWMGDREAFWSGEDNFFKAHNWWHRALYHFDLGEGDAALAIYDAHIGGPESPVALDLADAASFLWRACLEGVAVGARWRGVAERWDAHADGALYPFNDWHAVMAYLGAGREADAERLIARLRGGPSARGETARWARSTGLALAEGFAAFWRGDHASAVARLFPARHIANTFGGSHAQREVIDRTLADAAIRAGMRDVAEALANERLAVKPHSVINTRLLARARMLAPAREARAA